MVNIEKGRSSLHLESPSPIKTPLSNPGVVGRLAALLRILALLILLIPGNSLHLIAQDNLASYYRQEEYRVLLLHSYDPDYTWTANITEGIRNALSGHDLRIDLIIEYMDTRRFGLSGLESPIIEILKTKYGNRHLDAIVCADDNALEMVTMLDFPPFNNAPLVACGINSNWKLVEEERERITGVFEEGDSIKTMELAVRMHPDSRHFVGIFSDTEEGRLFQSNAREQVRRKLHDRELIELFNLSIEELIDALHDLPADSVILSFSFTKDRLGRELSSEESFRLITENCNLPIYTGWDAQVKMGATGGVVTSGVRQGEEAGFRLIRILQGEEVLDVEPLRESPNITMYNYEDLERTGLKLSDLPEDAVVINQPPSLYETYKVQIWIAALLLLIQTAVIVILIVNIIRRRRAETAMHSMNRRLEYLLSSISVVLFTLDPGNGNVSFISRMCQSVLGYTAEEFMDDPDLWDRIVHPEDMEERRAFSKLGSSDGVTSLEYRIVHKDGTVRWILDERQFMDDEILGYLADRTSAKITQEQKEQSQKMEAVGRLAAGIAHDFNNMLSVIGGHAEMMLEEIQATDPAHESLQSIQNAADHSAALTRQLLAFSRKQIIDPKNIVLNNLIRESEPMLTRLIGENVKLEFHLADDLKPVRIDPSQLHQILLNMIVNARDAIDSTGQITVETQNFSMDAEYSREHIETEAGEYVMLVVSDTGSGMDKKTISRIFEPFFSTKEAEKGTGLGLATTYGIVKQNQGHIHVYSEPGKGTTFKIYFPVAEEEEPALADVSSRLNEKGGHETILIVEDEEQVRKVAALALKSKGYRILETSSPDEALEISSNTENRIDLLLTDVIMPEMNGRDLQKMLLARRSDLKTLFMSGYTANVIAHQGILEEGINFIQKPFSPRDLTRKIRFLLDQ